MNPVEYLAFILFIGGLYTVGLTLMLWPLWLFIAVLRWLTK